jgi:predicted Zn finger-like uncharacterized protein
MIVQCPSCTSRYRIRDANIPPSGGKIRCPSCSHSFIVYPESEEDEQKTSITGSNEIAKLLGGEAEDDGKTEIVQGDALDKMRALEALKNEMGSSLEGDGTVEIKNPLDMWKAAQAARQASADAAEEDEADASPDYGDPTIDHDDYDMARTEIVSPDALNIPIPAFSSGKQEPKAPSIPKPNLPKPNAPTGQIPPPNKEVWQDPDRTVDAGFHVETASLTPPKNLPPMREDSPPPQSQPPAQPPAQPQQAQPPAQPPQAQPPAQPPQAQPPAQPPQAQPPAQPASPVSRDDSGPQSPQTDPFSLPESDPFAAAGSGPSHAPEVPVGSQANDPFANAQADAGSPPKPAAPDPQHQGPWKLKTNFGLTYEFPDNKSLRSWMSSREELDGHTLSADGENFFEIREFPQLHRSPSTVSQQIPSYESGLNQRPPSGGYAAHAAPSDTSNPFGAQPGPATGLATGPMSPQSATPAPETPTPSTPGFTPPGQFGTGQRPSMPSNPSMPGVSSPGFAQPPSSGPANRPVPRGTVQNEYVPPSESSFWDKILWLIVAVLVIVACVIGVQTFGVYDVVGKAREILGMPEKVAQPVPPVESFETTPAADTTAAIEPDAEEQAELAEQLMRDARRFIKKNKFPAALKKLETVEQIDDSNVELYELRAKIYDELGKADDAEAARAKIQELQAVAGDSPDAGTPDAS